MASFIFPQGFLWGTATSAHQVEGHNVNNDWWAWEQAGRVKEPSGVACDHYRRFREDFDLAKQLGHNTHRFSVEWSRIEPREGEFNDEALAHYQDVVRALRERGLEPVVTLHHFTNPLWLAKQDGWANPRVIERFAIYARRVGEALEVRYWVTMNEPIVYVWMHYLAGTGPPGEHNLTRANRVIEHLARAHVAAYHALHEVAARFTARGTPSPARMVPARSATRAGHRTQVGIATHLQPFLPCRRWWVPDGLVARLTHRAYNLNFLDAITEGRLRQLGKRTIAIADGRDCMDFLGAHYYGRAFMRSGSLKTNEWLGVRCDTRHHREVTERNALGWDVYPPGVAEILRWGVPYHKPIFITENGICTTDDAQRERFILRHLAWVAQAIREGIPVIGYLYWSLLDNFEWAEGYGPRFGLVEMDYATQQRRVRPSARRLADICRTNRLLLDA